MNTKIVRYGLAVIFGLALVSLTMHGAVAGESTEESLTPAAEGQTSSQARSFLDIILGRVKEGAEKVAEKTAQSASESFGRFVDTATEKAGEKIESLIGSASSKLFDKMDDVLGKDPINITPEMIQAMTESFNGIKRVINSLQSTTVVNSLTAYRSIVLAAIPGSAALSETEEGRKKVDLEAAALVANPSKLASRLAANPVSTSAVFNKINAPIDLLQNVLIVRKDIDALANLLYDVSRQTYDLLGKIYRQAKDSNIFKDPSVLRISIQNAIDNKSFKGEDMAAMVVRGALSDGVFTGGYIWGKDYTNEVKRALAGEGIDDALASFIQQALNNGKFDSRIEKIRNGLATIVSGYESLTNKISGLNELNKSVTK